MKKTLLFAVLLAVISVAGLAQSLSLTDSTGAVANNSTVIRNGIPNGNLIVAYFNVTNNSGKSIDVLCKKVEVSLHAGTVVTFCWASNCYPPTTFVSPSAATIEPGATNTEFTGDYDPQGTPGESLIRFVWFDQTNPTDSVCVNVLYKAFPLGIEPAGKATATAYPNPASSLVNFNYNLQDNPGATLIIRNLLGSPVKEAFLTETSGKTMVEVGDLPEGIYFYSVVVNGTTTSTKKLIIRH
jgi:hypothetical protein